MACLRYDADGDGAISKHELLQIVHQVQINGNTEKDLNNFLRHTVRPGEPDRRAVRNEYVFVDYLEHVKLHGENGAIVNFRKDVLDR